MQVLRSFIFLMATLFALSACGNKTNLIAPDQIDAPEDKVEEKAEEKKPSGFLLD